MKSAKAFLSKFNAEHGVLKSAGCIIGISVGQEYHESDKFDATVELCNEKFSNGVCVIAVCDTLQKYSLSLRKHVSFEEAEKLAREEGERWVQRNTRYLQKLKMPYKILYWDHWKQNEVFEENFKKITDFYQNNSLFKEAISQSVSTFSKRFRHQMEGSEFQPTDEEITKACTAYLLEECAVIMLMWENLNEGYNKNHIIYPGQMTAALSSAYDNFADKSKLDWIKIRFKDVKNVVSKNLEQSPRAFTLLDSLRLPDSKRKLKEPESQSSGLALSASDDLGLQPEQVVASQVLLLKSFFVTIKNSKRLSSDDKKEFANKILNTIKIFTDEVETFIDEDTPSPQHHIKAYG